MSDDVLLSKIRLGIVAELLAVEWAGFSDLQRSLAVTNGNLGAHLAKLVEAGFVDEDKSFVGRRPQTRYRLTTLGRDALVEHVRRMQELLTGAAIGE
jgi:DNA-binding HxlR family transcriptional regulator